MAHSSLSPNLEQPHIYSKLHPTAKAQTMGSTARNCQSIMLSGHASSLPSMPLHWQCWESAPHRELDQLCVMRESLCARRIPIWGALHTLCAAGAKQGLAQYSQATSCKCLYNLDSWPLLSYRPTQDKSGSSVSLDKWVMAAPIYKLCVTCQKKVKRNWSLIRCQRYYTLALSCGLGSNKLASSNKTETAVVFKNCQTPTVFSKFGFPLGCLNISLENL